MASSPIAIPSAQQEDDASSVTEYTSPPTRCHLPPSPSAAPSSSILLNPLPPKQPSPSSRSPTSLAGLLGGAPFRRVVFGGGTPTSAHPAFASSSSSSSSPPSTSATSPSNANAVPGPVPSSPPASSRRRPSIVVEVVHSPPPAHFFADDNGLDSPSDAGSLFDGSTGSGIGRGSYSRSPPRASRAFSGMRSRSVSPAGTPLASSPVRSPSTLTNPAQLSPDPSASGLSVASSSGASSGSGGATSASGSVKFAPLPPGRRAHRSNSLSIGVASRAKMIQAQGGTPDVRGARYAGPLQWYEGGPLPEDVYTYKDLGRGLSKLFKRVSTSTSRGRARSASTASATSVSSATSASGSEKEARRMEEEAKGKGSIEHIEEAEEDEEEEGHFEEVPATVDDDEDEEGETGPSEPDTPPDREGELGRQVRDDDEELEALRRARKGKGKERAVEDGREGVFS
ncbi:hypothetical protein JCM8097_005915 [Rhodosporidiobolus ruineniae]